MKEILLGKSPSELKETVLRLGLPAFTAKQIANWLYVKREFSFANMTDISKAGRELLENECDTGLVPPLESFTSADGTRKYLFPVEGGAVEAVVIPDGERRTLCVSSQVGCKMGCAFCMTGRQGFHGNLTAAQILSQFLAIEEAPLLTNAVFMGMGEPLDNYSNVMKAIEAGIPIDENFLKSPKKAKSLKKDLLERFTGASVTSFLGAAFLTLCFTGADGKDSKDLLFPGFILLGIGIALFIAYFVGKKMLAKEIEAEEKELTEKSDQK